MARIQEVKMLLGGMDKENSPETINIYDYLDAHNIRTVGNDQTDANYLSNLEGTLKVTVNLPSGQNKSIGSKGFETSSKAYVVRYNSQGRHQIVEFDYDTSLETVIFENMTDTNDIDILGWTAETFFSDMRLMHDRFLILNNGDSYPLLINVEDFKSKRGTRVITIDDLVLPKIPPTTPIKAIYLSDSTKSTNSLRGNLFQFRYNFEYSDFRSSSWSAVSRREVPINEPSEGNGQNVSSNNVILLKVDLSQESIEKVNIAVRIGLGNWLLVNTSELSRIQSLPNTSVPYNSTTGVITNTDVTEAYDPVTKEYQILFYNNGLYPIEDQIEIENPYDAIPQKSETLEVINGNVLAVGGLTDGYDRPQLNAEQISENETETVGVEVSYYDANLKNNVETKPNFDIARVDITGHGGITKVYRWYIKFNFVPPRQGDKIVFEIKRPSDATSRELTYTVTSADALAGRTVTIQNAVNSMITQLPDGSTSLRVDGNEGMMYKAENPHAGIYYLTARYVVYATVGNLSTQSVNTLKNGGAYQVAVAYYDKFGRYFPLVTDERFIARTESLSSTEGLLPEINWSLPKKAPEEAVGYNLLLSENQTYQNYITLTGVKEDSSDDNYLLINLKSLARFNEYEQDSQVSYDFTAGDKATFIKTIDVDGTTLQWFRYHFIELDIVDFKIETITTPTIETKYLLKVRNTPLLKDYILTGREIVLELYTPKAKAISEESTMFYEIGESYKIVNGEHEETSGVIRTGDSYYRGRLYRSSLDINKSPLVEVADPNFSDNYISNFWSAGRARLYDDEVGRVEQKASIRYSDEYTIGSKYNGINRFYLERIYGEKGGETTSKYGAIKKLEMRDNALVCIQETKVGVIPVYRTIIQDNADTQIIADSTRIFGSVQYRIGNYGCGNAKESIVISRDGVIYFFDDNNCLPVRDSLSGLDVIDLNMTSYFIDYMKQALIKGAKFIGYYDNLNKEYNLTIEDKSSVLSTLLFADDNSIYKDSEGTSFTLGVPNNGTATISTGNMVTYTPNTDYLGQDSIPINIDGGVVKYVPINVTVGDATPNPFSFPSKTSQQLSTLVESNSIIIGGINMPSPISIVGGEYSVNGGTWRATPSTIIDGDSVKVRLTTSGSNETSVTTTLTVGGVSGTFTATTIPVSVEPSEYFQASFSIIPQSPQSGSFNSYKVRVTLSNTLSVDYECQVQVQYRSYGSLKLSLPVIIPVLAGELQTDTDYFINDADPIDENIIGTVTYSDVYQGDIITTADLVTRVVTSPIPLEDFNVA